MTQTASIPLHLTPDVRYLLRVGDTCLILAQRLGEWCGHAPILEEDIALANMALDLLGQARAVLTLAGEHEGQGWDEDQLAFLREERDYFNLTLVELPRGDFAVTVVRNLMVATLLATLWQRLTGSRDAQLAAIAGQALKEARYHQQHAADWVVRLGDGTDESARRTRAAVERLWRYVPECFQDDEVDAAAQASGLGPNWSSLRAEWEQTLAPVLALAQVTPPPLPRHCTGGKQGRHSEHMGHLLAEMQILQRTYPGGVW